MAFSWPWSSTNLPSGEGGGDAPSDAIAPIPEDTLGLRVLGPSPTDADVECVEPASHCTLLTESSIVAVHGLGGDAFTTWTAQNGKLWLRDFLPNQLKDPPDDFKNGPSDTSVARVMTFGYDVNIFTKASKQRSFTFAESLLTQLNDKRAGTAKTRPLILVGHSLGGIVIKKALVIAQARQALYGDILRSIVHLCLFGTPHQGANSMAGFLRTLGSALTGAKEGSVLRELQLWSPSLIEANSLFAEIADGFTITTFFETEKYHGVQVVDEGSAKLNKTKETTIGLNRNHITMCKFASVDEACYRQVFGRLHAEISEIGTKEQIKEQETRVQWLLEIIEKRLRNEKQDNVFRRLSPLTDSSRLPVTARNDILSWIHCTDYRVVYGDHLKKLYAGIGEEPLGSKTFLDWFEGRSKWLWCYGMPGAGKTAFVYVSHPFRYNGRDLAYNEYPISTIVIRHILEAQKAGSHKIGLAYLYCSHSDKSQSALLFVRTMLHQLVEQSETVDSGIVSFYRKYTSLESQSVPGIEDYEPVLGHAVRQFDRVYVVVDALDECRDDDNDQYQLDTRSRLLQTFRTLGETIHLLITSRDESHMTTTILGFDKNIPMMKVLTTDEDIRAYVNGRIAITPKLRALMTPELIDKIKETMVEKAAGMFLPAQLYMNILADISRKRVTSLVMTTSQNLPTFHDKTIEKDYKSAYQEILKNIWEQDPNDVDYARKVLSWVIFTKDLSSLKLPLLQGALSLENSENGMALTKDYNNEIAEQDLLSVCRGLVTIDHESRNIRFVHYTAEIYFASAGIQRDFFPYAQKQLARTCLKCLLSDDRDNHSLYDHPLYHYASRHWGHHAQAVEEEIQKQIEGFFGHSESVVNSFRLVVDALPFDWKPRSLRESEQTCLNPLHVAAYFGLKLTATNLLENGIDLEVADCRGWTPMRWAIIGATDEMVDLLFKHKASIISTDVQEQQTVFWAVGSRVSERLTHYWLSGNCKAILGEVIALKSEESFATALPSAVTPRTSPSVVKFLLSNIPSVDVRRTIDGRTLLSVVAENWQWDGVKILLGRGANVNLEDENGMTPLLWALQPPRFKTISEFIVVTDGVRLSIGDSSNIEASTELNIDNSYVPEKTIEPVICQLIGCNLEARDEEGKTALSLAAENKFHKVLGCLLENGAEPNTFDCSQMTPLHYASSLPCFRTFVIKVLECRGSDRVRLGAAKLPGLPLAKVQRPLAVQPVERSVDLLLQHGSRRDYKNCRGLTALALAILDGLDSAAALLRGPNTRRASLALGFNDERPGGNHTPKDNIQEHSNDQDLKERQRRDYTKLLLAMLERRARFHIDCARTYGTSMLLVSSTSDILNLQTSDTSQVLIADKSNLAQVSASDASVVIVRDAATIDRLLTGGASRAFIQGLSQISYVLGSGSSTLTIEAGSKISSLAFHGRCSITTRGNSEVREIRGSGDSRLTIEADSKISSLAIDGQCLITARGNSEVKEIRGSGDARLTIEADSKISSLAIDGRCSITARGNSEVREIRGSGDARLTIEADSKISSLAIDGQCLITARGNSEVKEIRGSGDARLTIEADSKVSSLVINGQCSIIAKGHASISRVNGWGSSSLSLQANTSIDSMVLYGRCLLLSRGNSKIWTTKGYDSSILAIINNIQHQPTFFEIHDKAICFRPCEPEPYLPGDTSNVDNDTVDLPTPSSRNSLSESEALAILKEILAKRGYDNIFSRLDMETELPSLGYGDEYSEKGRGSDAEESCNGNKNMSDDEQEGEEKNQDVAISIEKEDWGWVKELL